MQFSKVFFYFLLLNNYSAQNPLPATSQYICLMRDKTLHRYERVDRIYSSIYLNDEDIKEC